MKNQTDYKEFFKFIKEFKTDIIKDSGDPYKLENRMHDSPGFVNEFAAFGLPWLQKAFEDIKTLRNRREEIETDFLREDGEIDWLTYMIIWFSYKKNVSRYNVLQAILNDIEANY